MDNSIVQTPINQQKQEQVKQIKLDLNTVLNPHPLMLAAYEEKHAMELFTQLEALRPEYVNEDRLFKIAKMSGAPIKFHIGGIYRKVVDGKEYIIAHQHLTSFDYYKNPVDHTRFLGKITIPDIVTRFNLPTTIRSDIGKLETQEQPAEINGFHEQYLYPFAEFHDQLQEWYTQKILTDDTRYYYWNDEGKIPVHSFEEFLNMNGDDLILLAKSKFKMSGVFKANERAEMLSSLRAQIKEEMKDSGFFKNK